MTPDPLRVQAHQDALHFLENDTQYRMGFVDAEKPHPMTRYLSQTFARSMDEGIRLLLEVDRQMAIRSTEALATQDYATFADQVRKTLADGGRVIFSGCGSSGRLSMRLEQSWRNAVDKLSAKYPQAKSALEEKREAVINIMTGGDYAVIRAAESFEDSTALGQAQAQQWQLNERDLLVGVTATGETTSILGTALQALADGAKVYMLICSDPKPVAEKLSRARKVFTHPNCRVLSLPCGPMALTGSTRMQSSTFEQFAAAVALEGALCDILRSAGVQAAFSGYARYAQQFLSMTEMLLQPKCVSLLSRIAQREQSTYECGGLATLFADDYLLDVLTDTTERAPTFMTPPFCSEDMTDQPLSWAFVKNPNYDTITAWHQCFLRAPRCIEWGAETYEKLGLTKLQIEKIPDISSKGLHRFAIGNEPAPQRENSPASFALWVDAKAAPQSFFQVAAPYAYMDQLTLEDAGITLPDTGMDLYEHLAVKLLLNTLSTGVMARMGRITGNWMTNLAMANKKLVDRSARIVSDLCKVPYEEALEELFYAKAAAEARGDWSSPVGEVIRKLGIK